MLHACIITTIATINIHAHMSSDNRFMHVYSMQVHVPGILWTVMATMSSSILLQLVAWIADSLDGASTVRLSLEEEERFLDLTNGDGSTPSI